MGQADAVCAAFDARAQPLPRPRTYGQVAAYVTKNLPLYEAALRRLEALKPAAQDRVAVSQWLAADRRVDTALRALGDAALRHDFPAVTAAALELQSAGFASRQAAIAIGLRVCGTVSGP